MCAELQHLGDARPGQHRTDREPAAERLGQGHDVGLHVVPLMRKQATAAAHAALDFVEHQQRVVAIAQRAHAGKKSRCSRAHAALALNRFEHHRRDIGRSHRLFERFQIVERAMAEAAGQRFVALLILGLRSRGDGGQGAAVEAAFERDDDATLGRATLIAGPAPHQFDCGLVGLGTGIAQEHAPRKTRFFHQGLRQAHRRLGIEHVAGVPQLVGLGVQCRLEVGIAVAERVHRDAGGKVHIVAALDVPQPSAQPAIQHQRARPVHRQPVLVRALHNVFGSAHVGLGQIRQTGIIPLPRRQPRARSSQGASHAIPDPRGTCRW